jgi:hypothetical protein
LIAKELARNQASFLVITIRNRLMALPAALAHKVAQAHGGNPRMVQNIADALIREVLNELAELPQTIEPSWLDKLANDGDVGEKRRQPTQRKHKNAR